MAGFGTKVFIFALILSFCFNLWAGTKIAGVDAGSTTYNEATNKVSGFSQYVTSIQDVIKNNLATSAITAVGIVFGNPYLAFAGIALTLFNLLAFPAALLSEASIGTVGTLISNMISFLYALAAITWFAGRGDF